MFPEDRISVKEKCVIIVVKVVCIGQMIVTYFAGFPRVDTHRVGHIFQLFAQSVTLNEDADGCHRRVLETPVDCSSAEVVIDAPVRKSILFIIKQW
jgi:hypothetical protein